MAKKSESSRGKSVVRRRHENIERRKYRYENCSEKCGMAKVWKMNQRSISGGALRHRGGERVKKEVSGSARRILSGGAISGGAAASVSTHA